MDAMVWAQMIVYTLGDLPLIIAAAVFGIVASVVIALAFISLLSES